MFKRGGWFQYLKHSDSAPAEHLEDRKRACERGKMAMDVPFEQINQVQISLRKSANLSSYDPDDPSFHNLPSAEEAIAELDPSPPYLRCKHCKGRLLRGVQSLICVFCGREVCKDIPPDPINFRNTIGYRWLLDSLKLDGSVCPSLYLYVFPF